MSYQDLDLKYDFIKELINQLTCNKCSSDLVKSIDKNDQYPEINLKCIACSNNFQFSDVIEDFLRDIIGLHSNIMGEMDSIIEICPSCNMYTFLYECECCVACGEKLSYSECFLCGKFLGVYDQENDGLCSYHANIMSKDWC